MSFESIKQFFLEMEFGKQVIAGVLSGTILIVAGFFIKRFFIKADENSISHSGDV